MRSQDLASLAGVSTRTLRHYHQMGLLQEPERSSNGYRRYTATHLGRLLRIARFAELGFPLSDIRDVIDDASASRQLLESIDAQAASDIEVLLRRRARIAQITAGGASPDLPEALIPFAALLASSEEATVATRAFEREQLALVAHLSKDVTMSWFVDVMRRIGTEGDRYRHAVRNFTLLDEDAGTSTTDPLINELVDLLGPAFTATPSAELGAHATELILAHQQTHLNLAQRHVMDETFSRIDSDS